MDFRGFLFSEMESGVSAAPVVHTFVTIATFPKHVLQLCVTRASVNPRGRDKEVAGVWLPRVFYISH